MLRTCSRCSLQYEHYGQRAALCRECRKIYNRNRYHTRVDKVKAQEGKTKGRERTLQFVLDYLKEHPCVVCGEADPVVLDFDHLNPEEKTYNVSRMHGNSIERIKFESCPLPTFLWF